MNKILPIFLGIFLFSVNTNAQVAGNCLNFDGVDDHVIAQLPSVFTDIGTNDFTIELWVEPTLGNFQRIFFAQDDGNNFASITLNSTGEVVFYLEENGNNHSVQSTQPLNSLEWAHISVTWIASTSQAKIYVNGEEVIYLPGVYVSSTGNDNLMSIGSKTDGSQPFLGEIDEVAVWSIAKFDCMNSFEMNDKKLGSEPNLVASYIFDAGSPGAANPGEIVLTDMSSAANDGALMNFALTGSTSNWMSSNANIIRLWGAESQVFLGQLGLMSSISAQHYQWIYCADSSYVAGATNLTFDPPTEDPNYTGVTDAYAVISTTGNCVDISECYWFNGNAAIGEIELESLVSVYPNPSQGEISIKSDLEIERIEIRSITGELVQTIQPTSSEIVQIDLAKENGFYLVVLHTSAGVVTKKILVQN